MRWLREHTKLLLIMSVILFLMIGMIISFLSMGRTTQISKMAGDGITAAQGPFSRLGNEIAEGIKSVFSFSAIKKENEELKKEITRLNRNIIGLQLDAAELEELRQLKAALNYQGIVSEYNYVSADVTAIDDSDLFNIFTINIGEKEGAAVDSVVVDGDGLIGRIYSVGSHWAKVISVVDENNSVSFRVLRDMSLLGVLSGDGKGGLNGYMLDSDAAVIEGDELITSGLGSYPEGIAIGKVTEVVWQNDQLIKAVTIEPCVNFKDIRKVFVVISPK